MLLGNGINKDNGGFLYSMTRSSFSQCLSNDVIACKLHVSPCDARH